MSKKVLIIGATGSIGSKVRRTLLQTTDYKLTLFSTRAGGMQVTPNREVAVSGNVMNKNDLMKVLPGQDCLCSPEWRPWWNGKKYRRCYESMWSSKNYFHFFYGNLQ